MVSFISTIETFSQEGGKGRYRKVALTKGAKKNGYTVIQHGRDEYFLQVNGAEDPLTKKKLEGEKEVEFRCGANVPIFKKLLFRNGLSRSEKVECLILISPRIIIQKETDGN